MLDTFVCRFSDEVDNDLVTLSNRALMEGRFTLNMYALMCWLVFSNSARDLAMKDERPETARRFIRVLTRSLLLVLHGLRPTGSPYTTDHNIKVMRKLDFFVLNMMCVYAHM
jgi:hypothetical protein